MRDNTVKRLLITITAYMMMNVCTVTFCFGFSEGCARGPLPPRLRGGLEMKVALLKPERPNSTRPGALLPPISLGRLSRGVTPPFLRFGEGPTARAPSLRASGAVSGWKWPSISLCVKCISPIFFEVGIPNLVCGCILGKQTLVFV